MNIHRETIARVEFRWRQHEEEFAERLAESAREAGRCPSDHARELMKDALTSTEQLQHSLHTLEQEIAQVHSQLRQLAEITNEIQYLREDIYRVQHDLARATHKLLTDGGNLGSEDAWQWVEKFLVDQ